MNTQTRPKLVLGSTWPVVPMCSQCRAVRVDESGDACRPCIELLANRLAMETERQQLVTSFYRAFVILAILAIGVVAAVVFE